MGLSRAEGEVWSHRFIPGILNMAFSFFLPQSLAWKRMHFRHVFETSLRLSVNFSFYVYCFPHHIHHIRPLPYRHSENKASLMIISYCLNETNINLNFNTCANIAQACILLLSESSYCIISTATSMKLKFHLLK